MIPFLALAWLVLTGIGLVHFALPSARFSEKLALAFPLSAGVHGAVLFVIMQCCGADALWTLPIFAPFLWQAWGAFRKLRLEHRPRMVWPAWQDALPVLILAAAVGRAGLHLVAVPALEWDSVAMWMFKGRALFIDGRLGADFIHWLRIQGLHPDYPWNVPIMQVWLAGMSGAFREKVVLWLFPLFFCSQLAIFFAIARLWWGSRGALWSVAFYAGIPAVFLVTANRDADMILVTLIAAGLFLLLRSEEHPETRAPLLTGLASFLCGWTKVEGMVFVACLLFPYSLYLYLRSRKAHAFRLCLAVGAGASLATGAYWILKTSLDADTLFSRGIVPLTGLRFWLDRVAIVAATMGKEMLDVRRWNLAWLAVPLCLWKGGDPYRLKFLVFGHLLIYCAVYILAPVEIEWHMRTSLTRILMHTMPALFAWATLAAAIAWKAEGGKR